MKATRHWLFTTGLLLLSLLLAACGGQAGTAPTAQAPTAAPAGEAAPTTAAPAGEAAPTTAAPAGEATGEVVELRMAWWGSQARHDKTLQVIELFQQQHPNIRITSEYGNFDDHWTRLATQSAGGNLPDIIQHDYSRIGEWVSRDLLLPLDGYVESGTINLENVAEEQLSGGRIDGQLYGVNLGTNALGVLYDPAVFEQAGVEPPAAEWTWADMVEKAKQISESQGIYGVESIYNAEFFKLWLKDHGQWMYNPEGTDLGYSDDALAAEYFQMLVDLQDSGASPTREFDAGRGTVGIEDSLIVSNQSAMIFIWSNMAAAIASASGERPLELALPPTAADGGQGVYLKPSMFFSIPATTQHPEEAAMFIDFFTNSVEANEILAAERGVPISPEVREALQPTLPEMQQKVFEYISTAEGVAAPIDPPDPAAHAKVLADVYNPLIDQLLYGEITPEEAAAQLREQATAVLAEQ